MPNWCGLQYSVHMDETAHDRPMLNNIFSCVECCCRRPRNNFAYGNEAVVNGKTHKTIKDLHFIPQEPTKSGACTVTIIVKTLVPEFHPCRVIADRARVDEPTNKVRQYTSFTGDTKETSSRCTSDKTIDDGSLAVRLDEACGTVTVAMIDR